MNFQFSIRKIARTTLALLCLSSSAEAAAVIFDPPVNMTADTDALSTGTFLYGFTWNNTTRVINGVTFTTTNVTTGAVGGGSLTLANFGATSATAFTSTTNPYNALSAAYKGMTNGAVYNAATTGLTGTVTLNNLTVGVSYKVQVWVADPRAGATTTRVQSITGPAGSNTQPMDYNVGNVGGGVGQYVIGQFTADATTQVISITSTSGNLPQINAMQVRTGSATNSWSGQVSGIWDETTANFSGQTYAQVKAAGGAANFSDFTATNSAPTRTDITIQAGGITGSTALFGNSTVNYTLSSTDATGFYGTFAFSKSGAGILTLLGANTHTGDTNLGSGTLRVAHTNALANSTMNATGGTLTFQTIATATFGGLKGTANFALQTDTAAPVTLTVGANTQSTTYAGALSGAGRLVKAGTGVLTLATTATHANTTVSAGTLIFQSGNTSGLTLTGGTLSFANNAIIPMNVSSLTQSGGTLQLDIGATGTDTLNVSGNASFTGGNIQLNFLSAPPLNTPISLVNYTGTLTGTPGIINNTRLPYVLSVGTGTNSSLTITFSAAPTTLRWRGNLSTVWANDPVLNFINADNLADRFYPLDTVLFEDAAPTKTVAMSTAVLPSLATIRNSAGVPNNFTVTGSLAGGRLVKEGLGTAIFTANTNAPTSTTVSDGVLQIGNGTTVGAFNSGIPITVEAAGTLRYQHSSSPFNTQQPLTGTGTVLFQGTTVINQSGYAIISDNSLFAGTFLAEKARVNIDLQADVGSALLRTGDGGQIYLTQVGQITNNLEIIGNGWPETAGSLGALRMQNNTYAGQLTLTGNARIAVFGNTGALTGSLGERGGSHALEMRNLNTTTNGSFALSATSSRTGPTALAGAVLAVQNSTGLGTGALSINSNGTAARLTRVDLQNVTLSNPVTCNSDAQTGGPGVIQAIGGGTSSLLGQVTIQLLPGNLNTFSSDATSVLNIYGAVSVTAGQIPVVSAGTVGFGGGGNFTQLSLTGGTLRVLANQGLPAGCILDAPVTAPATFDLNGNQQTLSHVQSNALLTITNTAPRAAKIKLGTNTATAVPYRITNVANGPLTLEKYRTADLILPANTSYTGDTIVSEGQLTLTSAFLANQSDVLLATGTTLNLQHLATDAVDEFFINGVAQAAGLWGPIGSGAIYESPALVGTGYLLVINGPVPTAFQLWIDNYLTLTTPGQKASNADPDGDGANNLAEFAFGSDPADVLSIPKPICDCAPGIGPSFFVAVREGAVFTGSPKPSATIDGITYTIEGSLDLITYAETVTAIGPCAPTGQTAPACYEWQCFRLPPGLSGFLRVQVSGN